MTPGDLDELRAIFRPLVLDIDSEPYPEIQAPNVQKGQPAK